MAGDRDRPDAHGHDQLRSSPRSMVRSEGSTAELAGLIEGGWHGGRDAAHGPRRRRPPASAPHASPALAEDGWAVAVADRQTPADGIEPRAATVDVRDRARAAADHRRTARRRAVARPSSTPRGSDASHRWLEITAEQWQLVVEVNLNGAFHAVPRRVAAHGCPAPAIVPDLLDRQARRRSRASGHYCASKAGARALWAARSRSSSGRAASVATSSPRGRSGPR